MIGISWPIEFDSFGNVKGQYDFTQYSYEDKKEKHIALWDKITETIIPGDSEDWSYFSESGENVVPDSVCSYPCKVLEYRQQKELACCWDCKRCRNNEKLNQERSGCEICPILTWPDPDTATQCVNIEPQ